jgi:flagellar hook assembly protein FlgD
VEVGPNPGSGPVRIAFALKHAGAIEIDVFDVQGRRVASPGAGVWPAGMHVVEWNGRTHSGEVAPSGLYLLRYAYPGGQDRRRIVRTR